MIAKKTYTFLSGYFLRNRSRFFDEISYYTQMWDQKRKISPHFKIVLYEKWFLEGVNNFDLKIHNFFDTFKKEENFVFSKRKPQLSRVISTLKGNKKIHPFATIFMSPEFHRFCKMILLGAFHSNFPKLCWAQTALEKNIETFWS